MNGAASNRRLRFLGFARNDTKTLGMTDARMALGHFGAFGITMAL